MTPGRRLQVGAFTALAAVAVVAVVFASRFGEDPQLVPSPLIGRPAPDVTLPRLDGEGEVRLTDLRGRIVVVNFFASWCLECRFEHDDLVAIAEVFADQQVQVIQVAYQDAPEDANRFLDELGRSPDTLYLADPGSRAAIAFGVFGVPETFFIDPQGVVVGKVIGESNAAILGETLVAITRGERPGQQVVGETQTAPEA